MTRLVRIAILLSAVVSLSAGAILLSRDHPLWWVVLLTAISISFCVVLERFAAATERLRSRPDAYDRRRVRDEWVAVWRRMLIVPPLLSVAFLLLNAQHAWEGDPFFDLSTPRGVIDTIGFPIVLPIALFVLFLRIRDEEPRPTRNAQR